jgi:hypothetical protein
MQKIILNSLLWKDFFVSFSISLERIRLVNVFIVDYENLTYDANTWDESYDPTETFDNKGYLTEEENITYNWENDSDGYKSLGDIVIPSLLKETLPLKFDFGYTDYLLTNNHISSFIADADIEYHYDVLDNLAWEENTLGANPSGPTGNAIRILGNAILANSESVKRYYVGSEGGSISEEEYYSYISEENVWPELREYYAGACEGVDENGICIINESFFESPCLDMDVGENASFVFSYVDFGHRYFHDSCKDNSTLIENYCGINILRWDLVNINKEVAKQREIVCEFGCLRGACLYNVEPECVVDDDCLVDEICAEGICVVDADLPEDPEMPRGNI